MKEDNTLLWVALIGAAVFVLTKTKLVSAQSGPSAILPPASAPTGAAALPPTPTQAASVPTGDPNMTVGPPVTSSPAASNWDSSAPTDFDILSAQ